MADAECPPPDCIRLRGARSHNLRQVDADLPHQALIVITGVSGSGKSSLAFDTLCAEGERRFLETLSYAARQALAQVERPEFDLLEGLPPTLSLQQYRGRGSSRSTLGTITEIHDYLRVWYARAGIPHCPQCGRAVRPQAVPEIIDAILARETGRKVMLLAPLVCGRKGSHGELFERICRDGFVRARVDGKLVDAAAPPPLAKSRAHNIEVVVDRIIIKEGLRTRLRESVELALKLGAGTCLLSELQADDSWQDHVYSNRFACPECQTGFAPIEPRTFSFNSAYGACPACDGLGTVALPEAKTAPLPCPACGGARLNEVARAVTLGDTPHTALPLHRLLALPLIESRAFIEGLVSPGEASPPSAERSRVAVPELTSEKAHPAARLVAERIGTEVLSRLRFLERVGLGYLTLDRGSQTLSGGEYQRARLVSSLGAGLQGVCYILDEPTIGLHPRDTQKLLEILRELRDQGSTVIVVEHDVEVMQAADYLLDIGPGAGRHGGQIVARGTPTEVAAAPHSLTARFLRAPTGSPFTAKASTVPAPPRSDQPPGPRELCLRNARRHNLKIPEVRIPLQALVCVTGVSGSGKTTLILETLVPLLQDSLRRREAARGPAGEPARIQCSIPLPTTSSPGSLPGWAVSTNSGEVAQGDGELSGSEVIDRLVVVDQSPLGRHGRSNPATATGLWDEIRPLFARTKAARLRGFRAGRFSFNHPAGRCGECQGRGTRRLALQVPAELEVLCPVCRGARFNRQTLEVLFRGLSVADVLQLPIESALEFFQNFSRLATRLRILQDLGLGYLALGQPAQTLSGGEAQRIRLAAELARVHLDQTAPGRSLLVLDEPTTGLHPADVERLLGVLRRLVHSGHSVLIIEHQLDVIAAADWILDIGPEGGAAGGRLVGAGPPAKIAALPGNATGKALRRHGPASS